MASERIPPHSIDAEASVLSLCMIDSTAMRRVSSVLNARDFYSRAHSVMFEACLATHLDGTPDVVRIASWLKDNGKLDEAGGMPYLTDILNAAPNTTNVLQYAKIVRDKSRVRRLIFNCQKIAAEGYASHGEDLNWIQKSATEIADIARVSDSGTGLVTSHEALRETFLQIQRNAQIGNKVTGLRTGIASYDELTLGLQNKSLYIVAARPSVGKSARVLQMATEVAKANIGVLFFSLEMTRTELVKRQISMEARIDATLLERGALNKEQWAKVAATSQAISEYPLWIDDRSDANINQIRERSLGAVEAAHLAKKPIGLIVVDYLQRVPAPKDSKKGLPEQVGDVARGLKSLAKELDLPVVSAAQIRRMQDTGTPNAPSNKRPNMDMLKASGDIEQEADGICILHRDGIYSPGADQSSAEFIIAKARSGRTGLLKLKWIGEHTLFTDDTGPEFP